MCPPARSPQTSPGKAWYPQGGHGGVGLPGYGTHHPAFTAPCDAQAEILPIPEHISRDRGILTSARGQMQKVRTWWEVIGYDCSPAPCPSRRGAMDFPPTPRESKWGAGRHAFTSAHRKYFGPLGYSSVLHSGHRTPPGRVSGMPASHPGSHTGSGRPPETGRPPSPRSWGLPAAPGHQSGCAHLLTPTALSARKWG